MFLYHMVPQKLVGETLLPRNNMRGLCRELYEEYSEKYKNRPHVRSTRIPVLNCDWGDVVFLMPVHPRKMVEGLRDAGFKPPQLKFFRIEASVLDPKNAAIWLGSGRGEEGPGPFRPFSTELLATCAYIPSATFDYYSSCFRSGRKPLLWRGVAHVLYKGEVDISLTPRIIL